MAAVDPIAARFPAVAAKAGHYESFYLKLCHPSEPLAAWIRYTVHKRPGEAAVGTLWFTLFEPDGPRASRAGGLGAGTGGGDWLELGDARIGADGAYGGIEGGGSAASWELRLEESDVPLLHLPAGWMYRAPLPRTKLLSQAPAARFSGRIAVDGRELAVDGWRGMAGHNWGAEHAERWIWLHGLTEDGDWLDTGIGRVRLGRVLTPWIAGGALSLGGDRYRLRRASVEERADGCTFTLAGSGVTVRGSVSAPRERFVEWVYDHPDGGSGSDVVNCSIADMRLSLSRRGGRAWELTVPHSAAYELGVPAG